MFIAHLPAGYLLSRLHPTLKKHRIWVMIGAILPDLDMLYFIIVDAGMTHHHSYLTHRPALWACLLLLSQVVRPWFLSRPLMALSIGGLLHMVLDSMVGAINWGWPAWDWGAPIIVVPAQYDWWVMSFLMHWTFGVELLICVVAAVCFNQQRVRDARPLR